MWKTDRSRERFWANVKLAGASECWTWRGSLKAPQNYGWFNNHLAHRLAYADVKGPIPPGSVVRHVCDVTRCVNPNHLVLGTQGDNMHDKKERGRAGACRGENQPRHKLTAEKVLAIRQAARMGNSQSALAQWFNISQPMVNRIVKRRAWAHLKDDADV